MRRGYLLVGDKSSVGGIITEGLPGITNNGRALAFIGSAVTCPACQSVGHIAATGSRLPGDMFGKTIALDGDVCVCRCAPPPRMNWSDATMFQDGDGSEASTGAAPVAIASVVTVGAAAAGLGASAGRARNTASMPDEGVSKLAGEPFSYSPLPAAGNATQEAARGVSEHDEAECHDQYERDMDECTAYRAAMGGGRWMDMCTQRAFDNYQTCRGY